MKMHLQYIHSSFFQNVLRWSIAVSTMCHHSSRLVAFLQAVVRLKFGGPRSPSIAWSQVWPGLPTGHYIIQYVISKIGPIGLKLIR